MNITAYRPTNRIRRVNESAASPLSLLEEVFPDFFTPLIQTAMRNADGLGVANQARFDIVERADRYEAFVELPGVDKENIEIDIDGARVRIKAEAKNENKSDQNLKDGEQVLYSERRATSWARSFELPAEVDEERAEANYENGVLKLTLPKKQVVQPKRLQVK